MVVVYLTLISPKLRRPLAAAFLAEAAAAVTGGAAGDKGEGRGVIYLFTKATNRAFRENSAAGLFLLAANAKITLFMRAAAAAKKKKLDLLLFAD